MDGGAVDAVIGKGLNIAVISALPAVDLTTVHVVLDGRLSHTVLFSVVQKGLTEPHSLCYSIHGECIVLSMLVLFEQLNYTTVRSIRLSFYLTLLYIYCNPTLGVYLSRGL